MVIDGGAFVICPEVPAEGCRLFARTCTTDEDCQTVIPGGICTMAPGVPVPYCASPALARDDLATVAANSTANVIDVLDNDTVSEGICRDGRVRITSLDTTGTLGTVTISPDGSTAIYTPPPGLCGWIDTFDYTALLGGGEMGSATANVFIACVCGDGITQSSEQCDDGNTVAGDGDRKSVV